MERRYSFRMRVLKSRSKKDRSSQRIKTRKPKRSRNKLSHKRRYKTRRRLKNLKNNSNRSKKSPSWNINPKSQTIRMGLLLPTRFLTTK